jgi:hypothetical protein
LTSTGPRPSTEAAETVVPPDVLGADVLVAGVVAAGADVVVDLLLLEPQAAARTATIGTATNKEELLTCKPPFWIDLSDDLTATAMNGL